jgi:hypothetical protein
MFLTVARGARNIRAFPPCPESEKDCYEFQI